MNKQVKEQIRAEIERLYDGEAPAHDQQCDFDDGYFTGIAAISKFIDSLPDEKPNEDLKEAAIAQANPVFFRDKIVDYLESKYESFIAGAKWQKAQMIKDAIDGECIDDTNAGVEIDTKYGVLFLPPKTFRYEDKVKIIIVKEEQK